MSLFTFTELFERGMKSVTAELVSIVSAFQKENPYPDYGILLLNPKSLAVIYVIGDGQEGDLKKLEDDLKKVSGVSEVEISDEGGTPDGFVKVWSQ